MPLLPTHSLTALTICTLIILLAPPPSLALCLTQCSNLVGDNSVGNKSILSHHHHHPRQFPDFPCFHAPEFSSIVSETSLATFLGNEPSKSKSKSKSKSCDQNRNPAASSPQLDPSPSHNASTNGTAHKPPASPASGQNQNSTHRHFWAELRDPF